MLTELIRLPLSKPQIKKLASGGAVRLSHAHLVEGGSSKPGVPVVLDVKTAKKIISATARGKGVEIKLSGEELQANMEMGKTGGSIFSDVLGGLMGGGVVGDVVSGTARLAKKGAVVMMKPLQSLAEAVIKHQSERAVEALLPNLPQGFLPVKKARRTRGEGLYPPGVRG
jgi:hypothetical protein